MSDLRDRVATVFGIDLAWSEPNLSGACALDEEGHIVDEQLLGSDDEIVAWVVDRAGASAVVAIDAPLLVRNDRGRRACEAELAAEYSSRKAGPHPSNRSLFTRRNGRIRGEDLSGRLAELGFVDPWSQGSRTLLEVYPHPALVEAFGLHERLLYKAKKGVRPDGRRTGLRNLSRLLDALDGADPALRGERVAVPESARGRELKAIEDRLDARVCAWIGAVWARHGRNRIRLFGSATDGHIAVPSGRFVEAVVPLDAVARVATAPRRDR